MKYGMWCIIPSPEVISVLSKGLDFVILDKEHGNFSYQDIFNCTAQAQREGKEVWARPSSNNESEILHLLDSGVDVIIVPHISNEHDAHEFIEHTTFPPIGHRGYTPFVFSGGYGAVKKEAEKYRDGEDFRIARSSIIEDMGGVHALPKILKENIDIIYIGIYDLSVSMGLPMSDPKVKAIFSSICKQSLDAGKHVGAIFSDRESLDYLRDNGVEYAVYKTDTAVIYDAVEEMRKW